MVRGRPGPAPQTSKREQFGRLIARGVPNAEACRLVGINRRTGTRWRFGREITSSSGEKLHYPAVINTRKREISPRYLSEDERIRIGDLDRDRTESERFIALRSHYGFDSFFCRPGLAGAHEKGGVEGEIGRFRRRHLVPVPNLGSLAELNSLLGAADVLDDARVITGRPVTVAAAFTAEAPTLMGLPTEPFDCARLLSARVDAKARVSVRQVNYSVPARFAGRRLPVRLGARTVEVLDGATVVARHERGVGKFFDVLALDHYLEVLRTKPGALPGATALAQARQSGVFTAAHQAYWDAARTAKGDATGTRWLIEILLAHRTHPAAALITAMDRAVASGALDPQVVIIDARRSATPIAPVVPIAALARYDRPTPTLVDYDDLLTGSGT